MHTLAVIYLNLRLLGLLKDALAPIIRVLFVGLSFVAVHLSALLLAGLFLLDRRAHVRWPRLEAWAVALASGVWWIVFIQQQVTGLAGWRLFGWLVIPLALLITVPVVREVQRWREAVLWGRRRGSSVLGAWRPSPYYLSRPFALPISERLKHLAVQGPTGSGKTTLLKRLIVEDLRNGSGLCVIDPKDDLIDSILPFVPKRRIPDVVLLDGTDTQRPLGFNPLSNVPPERRSLAAGEIVAILRRHFRQAWGPRLEHILTNAVLALLEVPGATLLDVTSLLVNADLRKAVMQRVTNPGVRDFFAQEFEEFLRRRGDALEPILNKIGPWRSYPELRGIIGQRSSTFEIRRVMDRGQILLIRIPQGALGEDVSSLLGSLVVAKLQLAAHSRVDTPSDRRRPFFLYVDEFQNFATESFGRILTEARGFGLGLICANQYAEQLPRDLQLAVAYNVATQVACSYVQGRYRLSIRRIADPKEAAPIVAHPPRPLQLGDPNRAERVRAASRDRYGVAPLNDDPSPVGGDSTHQQARRATRPRAAYRDIDEE